MLYEIGDPAAHILPDVVCDWRNVTLTEVTEKDKKKVLVEGARGRPPTAFDKVSVTAFDGFKYCCF